MVMVAVQGAPRLVYFDRPGVGVVHVPYYAPFLDEVPPSAHA
jgi:thioredoxin-related protein